MHLGFKKLIHFILACCICFPLFSFAFPKPLSLSAQMGPSQLNVGNGTLQVTPTETDTLHETDNPLVPEFSLGLNYEFPFWNTHFFSMTWFSCIQAAINLRYLNQGITGEVYQYQEAAMNNYSYELTLHSLRLMLDVLLPVFTCRQTTFYLLGGIGNAWNQLGYDDTPQPNVQGGALSLNNRTIAGFTYELGAGFSYPIDQLMTIFLEYRYAYFPKLRTAKIGTLNGINTRILATSFPLNSQTLAFGINWKI